MAGTDKYGDLRHSMGRHLSPYKDLSGPWLFRHMRCGNCKLEWEAKFLPDTYTVSSSGE